MLRLLRTFLALLYLLAGSLLGLLVLEGILRSNSTLLLRGMALPAPVDPPLTVSTYDVRYSDADAFYWRPDLVRPVPPDADRVEASVVYETDEFGFRNHGPIPRQVDAVVLGRSISLAGHLARPWPDLAGDSLGWKLFNLSQPGSGIEVKGDYLRRFGLPRQPRWVIIEVVPSIDLIGRYTPSPLVSGELLLPVLQNLGRQWLAGQPARSGEAIYPLRIDLPGRELGLTCCLHYLEFFSLDRSTLEKSQDWAGYRAELLEVIDAARSADACVALLYVPTKPDVYFPLAVDTGQLAPALRDTPPYRLGPGGWLEADPGAALTVEMVRANALAGHDLLENFARQNNLAWIDPNPAMIQAVLDGQDPFMVYDSHWNQLGHQIVAGAVQDTLAKAACP